MLKLFKYSWKEITTFLLVLICFSALTFCIFKVSYTLLTRPVPQSNNKWPAKNKSKTFTPRTTFTKNMFFLTLNDFMPSINQATLTEGKNYFIVKTIHSHAQNEQCLYGIFRLIKKTSGQLNFNALNFFPGKKMEQYGLILSQNIKYLVLEKEQLPTNLLNCKNWIYIDNSYKISAPKNANIKQTIVTPFTNAKCTSMSLTNLIAVRSDTPNIVYFDYDDIQNKLKMCIKKPGNGLIHIMTANSGKYYSQNIIVQQMHKKIHAK